jgi:hypothetical protein
MFVYQMKGNANLRRIGGAQKSGRRCDATNDERAKIQNK